MNSAKMRRHRYPQKMQPITGPDLCLLQELCVKYGCESIAFMVTKVLPEVSGPSRLSSSTIATYSGSDASGGLSRSGSNAGSIWSQRSARDSLTEYTGAPTPEPSTQPPTVNAEAAAPSPYPGPTADIPNADSQAYADSPASLSQLPKKYWCPLCHVHGIVVDFARKADCKRHVYRDHCTNSLWTCSVKECGMVFDFKRGYTQHAKQVHAIAHPTAEDHRQQLQPQLVYGCGFEGCKEKVFEASDEFHAAACAINFADHVAKHFDEGANVNNWQYSLQIRHLMYQSRLKKVWKESVPKDCRLQMRWKAPESCDLKETLEWRSWEENETDRVLELATSLGTTSCTPPPSRPLPDLPVGGQRTTTSLKSNGRSVQAPHRQFAVPAAGQSAHVSNVLPQSASQHELPNPPLNTAQQTTNDVPIYEDANTFSSDISYWTGAENQFASSQTRNGGGWSIRDQFLASSQPFHDMGTPMELFNSPYNPGMGNDIIHNRAGRYFPPAHPVNDVLYHSSDLFEGSAANEAARMLRQTIPVRQSFARRRQNGGEELRLSGGRPLSIAMEEAPPLEEEDANAGQEPMNGPPVPEKPAAWISHSENSGSMPANNGFRTYFVGQ